MATLIRTASSSGETGRCDARCYNAQTSGCHCCCGGKNHGAGFQQAFENTREMALGRMLAAGYDIAPEILESHLERPTEQEVQRSWPRVAVDYRPARPAAAHAGGGLPW